MRKLTEKQILEGNSVATGMLKFKELQCRQVPSAIAENHTK